MHSPGGNQDDDNYPNLPRHKHQFLFTFYGALFNKSRDLRQHYPLTCHILLPIIPWLTLWREGGCRGNQKTLLWFSLVNLISRMRNHNGIVIYCHIVRLIIVFVAKMITNVYTNKLIPGLMWFLFLLGQQLNRNSFDGEPCEIFLTIGHEEQLRHKARTPSAIVIELGTIDLCCGMIWIVFDSAVTRWWLLQFRESLTIPQEIPNLVSVDKTQSAIKYQ